MQVVKEQESKNVDVNFSDTSVAFAHKNDKELSFTYFIFRLMSSPALVLVLSKFTKFALSTGLPIKGLIKETVFKQFCGGENKTEYLSVISNLGKNGIGTILDYSVEGNQTEESFENAKHELLDNVALAKDNDNIPCTCMKLSALAKLDLLERVTQGDILSVDEENEMETAKRRFHEICLFASTSGKPLYVDAEESWIQGAVDYLVEEAMLQFNKDKAVVFTTLQMYRWDRLDYLKRSIEKAKKEDFVFGVKLVRGAYLEKENNRARNFGYRTPINHSKPATDKDYDKALTLIVKNVEHIELCAGTHNEASCKELIELMSKNDIPNNHPSFNFSQLYGMSDHISYNLAKAGYNVSKYLPYGPVESTIPYLVRRAAENSAIAGQMSQELQMIIAERQRRKQR